MRAGITKRGANHERRAEAVPLLRGEDRGGIMREFLAGVMALALLAVMIVGLAFLVSLGWNLGELVA